MPASRRKHVLVTGDGPAPAGTESLAPAVAASDRLDEPARDDDKNAEAPACVMAAGMDAGVDAVPLM